MDHEQPVLGVDIGGSSIKFCLVDSEEIVAHTTMEYVDRKNPNSIIEMIGEIITKWEHRGHIGIGFPGMVEKGIIIDAPNLDTAWEGYNLPSQLKDVVYGDILIINDADAAALAMNKQTKGWENENILCLTLGTGIGSAWLRQGELESGTEYGRIIHPELNCSLEQFASVRTMNNENLSIEDWAIRLCSILEFLEIEFKPDRFILSGGITNDSSEWLSIIEGRMNTPITISKFGDLTGSIGAAKLHSV